MIRVVLIGVSHWHLRLFLPTLRRREDLVIVGVSDPDPAVSSLVAEDIGCAAFARYADMIADTAADFALVLGPHVDMAETASFLIGAGVPFAIEKPAGLTGEEVASIASLAEERGAFAAVPFVFRQSDFVHRMIAEADGERFDHLSFTMIGRPPQQYRDQNSGWMLERRSAGGGALVNLGVHFLDLIPFLVPDESIEVVSAATSNAAWGLTVEDYAAVTLRAGSSIATIQTGYRYPSPNQYMDLHFSLRTASRYFVVRDGAHAEMSTIDGRSETWEVGTTNMPYYPRFVDETIDRLVRGEAPVADLGDAASAMMLLDRIYDAAAVEMEKEEGR